MSRDRTHEYPWTRALRFAAVLFALAIPAAAQVPVITSLQSSPSGAPPADIQGFTIDGPYSAFTLYVNGSFNPAQNPSVTWSDPVTNLTVPLAYIVTPSPTQIQVMVPSDLFMSSVVGSQARTILIRVVQNAQTSNIANFRLNAVMTAPASLPVATVGTPYSAPLVLGGTAPFSVGFESSAIPGMVMGYQSGDGNFTGTPTTVGTYDVFPFIYDIWENGFYPSFSLQVIANATISSVSPNFAPAGSGMTAITVIGANFLDPQTSRSGGSIVQWTFNNVTTNLSTVYVSPTQLTATVPTALLATPGTASVAVLQPNGVASPGLPFNLGAPVLTSISPTAANVGSPAVVLSIAGSNFASRIGAQDVQVGPFVPVVTFGNNVLASTLVNAGSITATIPSNLLTAAGVFPVRVTNPGGSATNSLNFTVRPILTITTTSLPSGAVGTPYTFRLVASGGQPSYLWNIVGLPGGLTFNRQTGDITGTPTNSGTFPLAITVFDSVQAYFQVNLPLQIAGPPPVTFSTSSNLPNGIVGVPYSAGVEASGTGTVTYGLSSGQLPDGLRLGSSGNIAGTPTRAGTFSFMLAASDSAGNSANKSFTIVILPSTLAVGDASTTLAVGTPATITLTATGGTGPYRFSLICTLPDGLSFSGATISGTPTTPGTTTCRAVVNDSQQATAYKDFTITVQPGPVTFTGGALSPGQVGVAYSARVSASGGVQPITYTGTGLPGGLIIASSGAISGTPTTAGPFSFTVTATDSARTSATATFTITIAPPALSISASLPDGVAGTPYTGAVVAAGGQSPYVFTVTGLPSGLAAASSGAISGTPDTPGTFTGTASVRDAAGATATTPFTIKITTPPLVITTASAPGGVVGTPYSTAFAATGGVAPLTWTASGAPGGLTMSAAGVLSGTPTTPGTSNVNVTVKDSLGTTLSKSVSIAITMPTAPSITFGGVGSSAPPGQQPSITVSLGSPYPADVIVTLTLTFAPDSGADDPSIQFATGGRTARVTIPAGSTSASTSVAVQTGTVAGMITITSQMQAMGTDVTPSPAPRTTIRIAPTAPVLTQATGARNSTGFTVTVLGFTTTREITQAVFQFNAVAGTTLQNTSLTITVNTLFSGYFGSSAAAPFGGQFSFTQPFTISGNLQGVASVTVTLANSVGASNAMTVNLN